MKKKTRFEIAIKRWQTCEICGGQCFAVYGAGWEYDRIRCAESKCRAETVFPTSTMYPGQEQDEQKWREDNQCQE